MSDQLVQLPKGWIRAPLEQVCDIILGQSPPGDTYNTDGKGLPFFQGKAEFGDLYPTPVKWCASPSKIAEPEDVLISVRAPVGPTNLAFERSCIGRGLAAIRPRNGMPSRYVLFALRATVRELSAKATGSTFEAVSGSSVRAHRIPVAPLPEQHRIVAEIEKQFTRLDAGVAALRRAQANLKRYRASVLKAACEGKLVPTEAELARADGREYESGAALLERILVERRASWAGRGKYKEPSAPEMSGLPELPEGWCWATVEQLVSSRPYSITDGPFGSNLKTEHYTDSGPRVIRLQNIGDGKYIDEVAHISQEHFDRLQKHRVFANDLVIAGFGDNPPRACIIPDSLGPAIVKADCIRFKPHDDIVTRYLNAALNSDPVRKRTKGMVHGVGRPRLNLGEIKSIVLPVPPVAEQQRIVAEVERRLSIIDELEAVVAANLQRAARLRQAVLQRAFSGELIDRDESDVSPSLVTVLEPTPGFETKPQNEEKHMQRKSSTQQIQGSHKLIELLRENAAGLSPEELYRLSGRHATIEEVESFYEELRMLQEEQLIEEVRLGTSGSMIKRIS